MEVFVVWEEDWEHLLFEEAAQDDLRAILEEWMVAAMLLEE